MKKTVKIFSLVFMMILFVFSFQSAAASKTLVSANAPEIKSIHNVEGAVEISWKAMKNAKAYEVYKKNTSGKWVKCAEVSSKIKSYKDSKVKSGKTYYYKIRAVLKNEKSAYANKSYMYLSAPTVKSTVCKTNGIYIKWNKSTKATGYVVYRQEDGSDKWKKVAKIDGNTPEFTDKNVKSGTNYTYKVKQLCGEYVSAAKKEGTKVCFLSSPKTFSVSNSPNGVTLKWSKVAGAKGYAVWRKTAGETQWKKIGVSKGENKTAYTDKKTVYGKKNYYKVRAYISSEKYGAFTACDSVYSIDPNKPVVALTYDDGPYTPVTNRILDTLEKCGARATFFVVGSRVAEYSDCIKRENALGCEIGNHTYNHINLPSASDSTIINEISKTDSLIKKYSGQEVKIVRAPGGAVSQRVKNTVSHPLVNWSVDTLDWSHRTASKTVANIKSKVKDGSIVLMHDLYPSTASATETIVPYLVKEGYQLVTVSEMMEVKGINMTAGALYRNA